MSWEAGAFSYKVESRLSRDHNKPKSPSFVEVSVTGCGLVSCGLTCLGCPSLGASLGEAPDAWPCGPDGKLATVGELSRSKTSAKSQFEEDSGDGVASIDEFGGEPFKRVVCG